VAAGERLQGKRPPPLDHRSEDSGMKKVVLVVLIAVVSLTVAAPSYASRGREAPPTVQLAKKKCKKKAGKKKKCKKKKKVTPAPTPRPLNDAEVINLIILRAAFYCGMDSNCILAGYYWTGSPGVAACTSKSTYQWACLGWNDENTDADPEREATCDFREIVDRVGIDGITSHQDLSFGPDFGFFCFVNPPDP
jgi:hypothetical protein